MKRNIKLPLSLIRILLSVTVIFFGVVHSASALECPFTKASEQRVSAVEQKLVDLITGAGVLAVTGEQSQNEVIVAAEYCADDERDLARMAVVIDEQDGAIAIRTQIPSYGLFGGSGRKKINLAVSVPESMKLKVIDGSGSVIVKNINALELEDSSGGIYIENIGHDVIIEDSSGEIRLENISGSVTLSDSSGAITVKNVGATVRVLSDSSGSIDIRNVAGDVAIDEDSSGSIYVSNVAGDFSVLKDSSGKIVHKRIAGDIRLPSQ